MDLKLKVWENLAGNWGFNGLSDLCQQASLDHLTDNIGLILKGQQKGRVVLNWGG